MIKTLKVAVVGFSILVCASADAAQTIRFATGDLPPYAIQKGDRPGFIREIVTELAKLIGVQIEPVFLPTAERYQFIESNDNILGFPMVRNTEREAKFTWLVKMFDMDACFMTLPGKASVESLDQVMKLPVGASKGSTAALALRRHGLENIRDISTPGELATALASGEIAAWYSDLAVARFGWRNSGRAGDVTKGLCLDAQPLWLGASRNAPALDVGAWQDAFQVLQQDGTFDRIYKSYGVR